MGGMRSLAGAGLAFALAMAVSASPGRAETYPARPIRLLVGFPAGGSTDGPARVLAEALRPLVGQPVIVDNKPGASGLLAVHELLAQPGDGYTLLLCTYIDPINPALLKGANYKPVDLQPVSQITRTYYALAVRKDLPAKDLGELLAYARARPGELTYGHVGPGSAPELVAKEFALLAGLKIQPVPFRGMGNALQELAAGRLDLLVGPLVVTTPLWEDGQVRIVGMTSPERLPVAPDVPTLREGGVDLVSAGWFGVCAHGLPAARVAFLNTKVREAVATPQFTAYARQVGVEPAPSTPEAFGATIAKTAADLDTLLVRLGERP